MTPYMTTRYGHKREMEGSKQALSILNEYGKSKPRVWLEYGWSMGRVWVRYAAMVILMMVVGVNTVMAQTDYSGTYYIASGNAEGKSGKTDIKYNSETPANNYYLCPTDEENWICYVDPDNYTNPAADNDQPFLTKHTTY